MFVRQLTVNAGGHMSSETAVETNVERVVPFLWVHDLDVSYHFYVDRLGFTLRHQWVDDGKRRWCWLANGNAAIMLQEFWREGRHRNLPYGAVGVGVVIYFICKDAGALYHEFTSRGVDASRPMVENAMWVTRVTDPDGYHVCFESPADAPDESTL